MNTKQILFLGLSCITLATKVIAMEEAQPAQSPTYEIDKYSIEEIPVVIGASKCKSRAITLKRGVQNGSWNHRFIDGNDGRYGWQHTATGERLFAVGDGGRENIQRFENEQGEYRYGPEELPHMVPLHNPVAFSFHLNEELPIYQLKVSKGRGYCCAYNAYKNCRLITQELLNPQGDLAQKLESAAVAYELTGNHDEINGDLGKWRGHILNNYPEMCTIREGIHIGGRLHPEGLRELIDLECDTNEITIVEAGRFQEHNAKNPFDVQYYYDLNTQDHNSDLAHGFIFQDRDHWLTAVLRRMAGQIAWFIADSNNNPAFNRLGLMHIIASVHGKRIDISQDKGNTSK